MTETLVGTLTFTALGKDAKVYKETSDNGNVPIICRNEDGEMVKQFVMPSVGITDALILNEATAKLTAEGWY